MKLVIRILLLLAMALSASVAAQRHAPTLARITNIYIPQRQPDSFRESLTRALTKAGFRVVTDPSQADAVLTILFPQADIFDDSNIPRKWIINFELAPNNKVIWKYRVESLFDRPENDFDYAAVKMAEKLLKDKEASVRKTAHK